MLPGAGLILNNIIIYEKNIAVTFDLTDITYLEINNFYFDSKTALNEEGGWPIFLFSKTRNSDELFTLKVKNFTL
jgi:hypothetical protein